MKKQFTARDLWRFSYLPWPQVSEAGRFAAVAVKKPGPGGACRPGVRLLSADTGEVLYETPADRRETQPCFLPDGSLACLLRTDDSFHQGPSYICYSIDGGYTSVMIDGSLLPFEENIALSRRVADMAGEIISLSSALSMITIFLWIFGMKQFGLIS